MPSMKSVISGHNRKLLRENREDMMYDDECVCNEDECLLSGNCQKREVVYRAVVKSENVEKEYIGQTKRTFKERHKEHADSFKSKSLFKRSKLSRHIWSLKEKNKDYQINWSVMSKARKYTRESKFCKLCNTEKTFIARQDPAVGLNARSELLTRCPHRDGHLLTNWVGKRRP